MASNSGNGGKTAHYPYLIVGGGMTADAAVRGIRQVNASDAIGVICDETDPPYNRPPLSKALWKGESIDTIWRGTPADNVSFLLSRTVTSIDPKKKIVYDSTGAGSSYGKLLLATGGRVRRLPFNVDGIIYFRTLEDYRALRKVTEREKSVLVIGGGFIGSEIAAALASNNIEVTMVFPEDGIGARVYPRSLSQFLNDFYRSKGVRVLANCAIEGVTKGGASYAVATREGATLNAGGIVAGIGIQPNQDLAGAAGLKVGNGIVVDEFLATTHPDIFAAGDVASFPSDALGKRIRVEHEDNANVMGGTAGRNMAGEKNAYRHLPFFYSDLFDLGYEAVGELDARYQVVEDWKNEFHEGVLYYLNEGRVRGVLLWNTWEQVDAARALIAEQGPFTAQSVKGRLPAIQR
jgi:NADPH-dependent 2,4-dienoyl-CoA reductase/sulfur reductase-like enzyme